MMQRAIGLALVFMLMLSSGAALGQSPPPPPPPVGGSAPAPAPPPATPPTEAPAKSSDAPPPPPTVESLKGEEPAYRTRTRRASRSSRDHEVESDAPAMDIVWAPYDAGTVAVQALVGALGVFGGFFVGALAGAAACGAGGGLQCIGPVLLGGMAGGYAGGVGGVFAGGELMGGRGSGFGTVGLSAAGLVVGLLSIAVAGAVGFVFVTPALTLTGAIVGYNEWAEPVLAEKPQWGARLQSMEGGGTAVLEYRF